MKFSKVVLQIVITVSFIFPVFAQDEEPSENKLERAQRHIPGVERIELDAKSGRVLQLRGSMSAGLNLQSKNAVEAFLSDRSMAFGLDRQYHEFKVVRQNRDEQGMGHAKLQHLYKGVEVFGSELLLHGRSGVLTSINGEVVEELDLDVTPSISAARALEIALEHSEGTLFRWQVAAQEALIKQIFNDPDRTWKPTPKLVVAAKDGNFSGDDFRLAYEMIVPIEQPVSQNLRYFVDASTGGILAKWSRTPDADVTGTGTGLYSGPLNFQVNSSGSIFELRDINRNVWTYDGQSGTVLPGVLFTDSNNIWDSANQAAGVEAHWGASHTYDYLVNVLGRNSIDDNGMNMIQTVHYDNNWNNAQWIGTQARFGDGDGVAFDPLVEIDIVAHEFGHGVTDFTSNLVYQGESGALNEAYSDMLGAQVEFFGDPGNADWFIGENSRTPGTPGDALRYMFDPNLGNDPDTYQGTFWASTTGPDNGGVHTNSGVANFQFYLLSVGGSGTNDNGEAYNVSALGINAASQIWYRAQRDYFGVNTQYAGARIGTVSAAGDIYGLGSNEVDQVENAWHAVGVGLPAGVTVVGNPTVYGSSTTTANRRAMPFTMPETGTIGSITMYHEGGGSGNMILGVYDGSTLPGNRLATTASTPIDGSAGWQTINLTNPIAVTGGTQIWLAWVYQTNPGIRYQSGSPGRADAGVGWSGGMPDPYGSSTQAAFIYSIYASYTTGGNQPPVANANGPYTGSTASAVNFSSAGSNDPDGTIVSYLWDFGDSNSSTSANPSHTYASAGTYNVSLTVTDNEGATGADNTTADISAPVSYASIPYATGFESGGLDQFWTTDSNTNANFVQNESWLRLDLSGEKQVAIDFWWKEYGDETHSHDGIYFSDNGGSSFAKVQDLNGQSFTNQTWTEFNLDVDALASVNGLSLSSTFVVKFQQYDNYGIATDGFAFDDINVAAGGNQAPVANANGPYTGSVGNAVSFSSAGSNDPDGTIVSYLWDFGDSNTSTSANPSHTYASAGTYNVSLTVTDNLGATGADNTTADISSAGSYTTIPYSTGFESGSLDQFWTTQSSNGFGRIQVTSANSPRTGSFHLTMDSNTNANFVQNESWLRLDLSGEPQVDLGFWWKEFGDETHAQDGVYFSDDGGGSFVKVQDLNGGSFTNHTWNEFNLDLDALAGASGLSLSSTFVVKFQQYDNYGIASDGFAFDDINVVVGGTSPANVGNTTVFTSTSTAANRRAMPFTMPETGTINSVTMYHEAGSGSMILAVYDGASLPGNLLAVTPSTAVSGSAGWQTINLTSPVNVSSGTQIWLAWVYQTNPGIRYQTGSPGRADAGVGWPGMPDPYGSSTQANFLYSVYATYTPSTLAKSSASENQFVQIPEQFALHNVYPNPFNPETTISFDLPTDELVDLRIYNSLGQLVRTLLRAKDHPAGSFTYRWDGRSDQGFIVPSGAYFIRINAGRNIAVRKAMMIK